MIDSRRANLGVLLVAYLSGVTSLLLCGCGSSMTAGLAPAAAGAAATETSMVRTFKFKTIVNPADPSFNQALGINDQRTAVGYCGSGAVGHPSQGYAAVPPFEKKNFTSENYPGSTQTQVTAINGLGDTAGLRVDSGGVVRGFIEWNGVFTSYADPNAAGGTEILGLNDSGIAVGFYTDASGVRYAFTLNQATGQFTPVTPPDATNVTASALNDDGDLVGFYWAGSQTIGFLEKGGSFTTFSYPGSNLTTALGVNAHDTIVGGYVDAYGKRHGFVLMDVVHHADWRSIDDPQGVGTTTINGVNDRLNMVGYYVDSSGNTDGMLAERKKE
jgi:hypothetical protein